MMSLKSFAKKNFKSLAAIALVSGTLGLTSCLDNDNDPIDYPPAGYISIYNGAPDNNGVIIFADQNQVNNSPLKYSEALAYRNFHPGDRLFKFSEPNSLTSLYEEEYEIKVDSVYSMFMVEEAGEIDAFLVKDNWSEPSSNKAQIRLVNLSPDAGNVSLLIDDSETPLFDGIVFKNISDFESIDTKKVKMTLVSSSGDTLATATNVDLQGNRVYTLIVRGFVESAENSKKLDLQLLTNYIEF
ncbi:DUF4397 domain-containing protein [Algoriphagus sp. AGSA1]|uniref:DUF4397 domain-containing protein n=1 Tax=Algoriphagus sp. AGSA1 TaxID=2907213 RepID=UPI001F358FDB|nr:DUF4397 domain-containing protein [Algoriphagus sp. AGSA1]MCE7053488.1 DUF4397 domain-containing protein [Algoriphagus sp. AGSA1]